MGAPLWPQTSVLGLRPLEFRILCLLGNTIWVISPSPGGSHGSVQSICIQRWSKPNLFIRLLIHAQTWEPQTQYVATNRGFKSPLHLTALNLNFVGLFFLSPIDRNFDYCFFGSHFNWNFRLQISDFRLQISEIRSPPLSFCTSQKIYIFAWQMELYSESPEHTLNCISVDLVLYHCLRR